MKNGIPSKCFVGELHVLSVKPEVIFIGGAARTGTTLLQNMLCASPEISHIPSEASQVRFLLENYSRLKTHNTAQQTPIVPNETFVKLTRNFLSDYFLALRNTYATHILVLKEPALTPFFPILNRVCREKVAYITIVRDPRDVIASMILWGQRLRVEDHPFSERNIERLCRIFMNYYGHLVNTDNQFINRHRIISFERLVSNADIEVNQLAKILGIKIDKFDQGSDWSGNWKKFSSDGPKSAAITEYYGRPPTSAAIGKYKSVLTNEEIKEIEIYCGQFMTMFGYESALGNNIEPVEASYLLEDVQESPFAFLDRSNKHKAKLWKALANNDELASLRYKSTKYDESRQEIQKLRGKLSSLEKILSKEQRTGSELKRRIRELESTLSWFDKNKAKPLERELELIRSELKDALSRKKNIEKELMSVRVYETKYKTIAKELPGLRSQARAFRNADVKKLRKYAKRYLRIKDWQNEIAQNEKLGLRIRAYLRRLND